MPARFIDTHAHLGDDAFANDADAVIAKALEAGVEKIIHPDVDSTERDAGLALCKKYPGIMYHMIGLYPGSVTKDWKKEMELAEAAIGPDTVALGEIGLDYHWSIEFVAEQKEAFKYQLALAARLDLPVNIHLRDATDDFFAILEECRHLPLRGNVHAFSGSYETFARLQKYGPWKVGSGGVVTYKNAKVAAAVKDIPLESIVLETDSPYLPPVPYRGQRNDPTMIPIVAAKIAEIKGIDIEEVAQTTTAAAKELFTRL